MTQPSLASPSSCSREGVALIHRRHSRRCARVGDPSVAWMDKATQTPLENPSLATFPPARCLLPRALPSHRRHGSHHPHALCRPRRLGPFQQRLRCPQRRLRRRIEAGRPHHRPDRRHLLPRSSPLPFIDPSPLQLLSHQRASVCLRGELLVRFPLFSGSIRSVCGRPVSFVHHGKSSVSAYMCAAPLLVVHVAASFYLLLLMSSRPCSRSLASGSDWLRPAAPTRDRLLVASPPARRSLPSTPVRAAPCFPVRRRWPH